MPPPPSELPMPPLTPARLLFLAEADQITRFTLAAGLALLLWDQILTLRREIEYVWRAKWTISKIIFLFNRYMTLGIIVGNTWLTSSVATGLTDGFCQKWILVGTAVELLCISFVSFVILFRLHAIWGGSRKTFLVLLSLWFLSLIASVILFFRVVYPARKWMYHEEYFNICFAIIPNLYLQWLPDALLHILMLLVLIWKAFATPRSSQTHMLAIMYREGILYYSTTLVVLLSGILIWRFEDLAWIGIPLYVGWVLLQISMSHLLLNLRSVEAFQRQAELISHQPNPSVEGYTLNPTISNASSSACLKRGYDIPFVYDEDETPRTRDTELIRSISPEILREAQREREVRVKTRTGNYRDSGWWWLFGRGNGGDERISVDATLVEQWDPDDAGPGLKESRLGRYDHWL